MKKELIINTPFLICAELSDLDPNNEKILNDLDRVIFVWHKQLYFKDRWT